jgi:23S rRNA (guanosine2251-2'-O)-methyltransferase
VKPPRAVAAAGRDRDSKPRARALGGDQVEGRQAVRELLLAGKRHVNEVWVAVDEGRGPGSSLADLIELARELRVPVKEVSRNRLDGAAKSEAPQGVLARCAPLREVDLDELLTRRSGTKPFLVAIDGVTDPGNFGALIRTAECAGATGVVVPRHRSVHVTPTVAKAAAGAVEHLPIAVVSGLPAALERLKDAGIWRVGLDAAGKADLSEIEVFDEPVILVFGAEGKGLSSLVRRRCDVLASIPIRGKLGSLNVAAAAAVACFEVARRRR